MILIDRGLNQEKERVQKERYLVLKVQTFERRFGDNYAEVTPVPIPNTEVKLRSADDTWRVTARENRAPPELLFFS